MHPIRSDALVAVGYDARRRVLTVQFRKGRGIYAIYGVPESLYLEMLAWQPHPWSRVHRRVMRYPKVRVGTAA